jgi:hypothetical protein
MSDPIAIGEYINHVLQLNHEKSDVKNLTNYIANVIAKIADISPRQIDRMRKYNEKEFPEGESISKLARCLPEIENIRPKDFCNRLLAPWDLVKRDQERMSQESFKNSHKIHIASGWEPPQALQDENICLSVVNNISQGLEYEFIFPPVISYPSDLDDGEGNKNEGEGELKKWLKILKSRLDIKWYAEQAEKYTLERQPNQDFNLSDSHAEFQAKIDTNIKFAYTKEYCNFWNILPSPYTVLYNLGKEDIHPDDRFGMFLVKDGSPIHYKEGDIELVSSEGWLYLCHEKYKLIEKEYCRIKDRKNRNELKLVD